MDKWDELPNNKLCYYHKDGFVVVKPKGDLSIVPLFCPKCEKQMKTSNDTHSFRKKSMCSECELVNWVK